MPEVILKLDIDNKSYNAKIAIANGDLKQLRNESETFKSSVSQWGMAVTGFNQALEMAKKVYDLISKPITIAADFEAYEVEFKVLLGSMDKAKLRITELSEFAAKTPFQFPEVIQASKQLEVLTKGALSTGEGLEMVGDVAAGTGIKINELASWFGRLYDGIKSGRPVGEALMRLQELGALSGDARGKIEDLQKANKSSAEVWKVVTTEMSRFNGLMKEQSEITKGAISNFEDNITLMLKGFGDLLLPATNNVLEFAASIIKVLTPTERIKTNFDRASESAAEQRGEFEKLTTTYLSLAEKADKNTAEQDLFKESIKKLNEIYPQYLTNVNLHKDGVDKVRAAFAEARLELDKYLEKMVMFSVMQDKELEFKDLGKQIYEMQKAKAEFNGEIEKAKVTKEFRGVKFKTDEDLQLLASAAKINDKIYALAEVSLEQQKNKLKEDIKEIQEITAGLFAEEVIPPDPDGNKDKTKKTTEQRLQAELKRYDDLRKLDAKYTEVYKQYLDEQLRYYLETVAVKKGGIKNLSAEELAALNELKQRQKDLAKASVYTGSRIMPEDALADARENKQPIRRNRKADFEAEEREKEEARRIAELRANALEDSFDRERELLENWYAENIETKLYRTNQDAKYAIDQQYYNKKIELSKKELEERNVMAGAMLVGYQSFTDNLLRTDMTGKEKKQAIWDSMKQFFFNLLADQLKEYLLTKLAEAAIVETVETTKTIAQTAGITAQQTVATGAAIAATAVAVTSMSAIAAAASVAATLTSIATFGASALAGSGAVLTALALVKAATMTSLAFEKGGRLKKGESGFIEGYHNEIIAPEKDFKKIMRDEIIPEVVINNPVMNLLNKSRENISRSFVAANGSVYQSKNNSASGSSDSADKIVEKLDNMITAIIGKQWSVKEGVLSTINDRENAVKTDLRF